MAADLMVTVGADASQYNTGMQNVARTAQSTANTVTQSLAQAAASAQRSGSTIARSSNAASMALTDLGRVAQDSPYGFIGISNNLNPLLESFRRLQAESGSTGGALRALGTSLTGAGGLGLALSVVTAAISFAQIGLQRWIPKIKEAKDETKAYIDTLTAANAATLKGLEEGQKDLVRLDLLYAATQNNTLAQKDRNNAYDELMRKYPSYFTNAERENTLLGKNSQAYLDLSHSILAMAYAKAAEDRISENANRQYENDNKILALQKEQAKQQAIINKEKAEGARSTQGREGTTFSQSYAEIQATNALFDAIKKINDLKTDSKLIDQQNQHLTQIAADQERDANYKTSVSLKDKIEKQKEQKTLLEQLEAQLKKLQDAETQWINAGNKGDPFNLTERERNINGLIAQIEKLKEASKDLIIPVAKGLDANDTGAGQNAANAGLQAAGVAQFDSSSDVTAMQNTLKALNATNIARGKALSDQEKFNESLKITTQVSRVFGQGLTNAFQSVLSGGQSFVSAMGQFLGDLITRLIAAAAAAALLAVILSAVGFGTGFAGAATEAGSFKNLFGSFAGLKLADGGITQGPTRALIGEGNEAEAVMPLSKLDQFVNNNSGNGFKDGQIVGVLRGQNLLLQMKRATKSQNRLS